MSTSCTEAGTELRLVLAALRAWGDKWAVEAPPVAFSHVSEDGACEHSACEHSACEDGACEDGTREHGRGEQARARP